jgi:hypothetical protein
MRETGADAGNLSALSRTLKLSLSKHNSNAPSAIGTMSRIVCHRFAAKITVHFSLL